MHELSIAMSILDAVEEEAVRRSYSVVRSIHIRIGALSGVVPEALHSAYELAVEHTRFAQTQLLIAVVPVEVYCSVCSLARRTRSPQELCCPICDTPAPEILQGRELDISHLEVES